MNIYLPGPSTILRYTISCGVDLASPALTALGEHVDDANNIAHTAYKAGGRPISTTFSDLRLRRGSRPAALVCTAIERVTSKVFYHKYRLVATTKNAINTAITVLETVEAVCAHHLKQTDSAPPAESLTSAAILGTRPCASAKLPSRFPWLSVPSTTHHIWRELPCQARQHPLPCLLPGFSAPKDRLRGYLRVTHRDDERAHSLWMRAIPYTSSRHLLSAYCLHRCLRLPPCDHFCIPCGWGRSSPCSSGSWRW